MKYINEEMYSEQRTGYDRVVQMLSRLDRRDEIAVWQGRSEQSVAFNDRLAERAREFAKVGIFTLDALHLVSAEGGHADVVLTCDDGLLRRSGRLTLALRVLNLVAYFNEMKAGG